LDRVLRRIFGPQRVREMWRKVHRSFIEYISPNIIRVIKIY